jgi:hypothetical protein
VRPCPRRHQRGLQRHRRRPWTTRFVTLPRRLWRATRCRATRPIQASPSWTRCPCTHTLRCGQPRTPLPPQARPRAPRARGHSLTGAELGTCRLSLCTFTEDPMPHAVCPCQHAPAAPVSLTVAWLWPQRPGVAPETRQDQMERSVLLKSTDDADGFLVCVPSENTLAQQYTRESGVVDAPEVRVCVCVSARADTSACFSFSIPDACVARGSGHGRRWRPRTCTSARAR